MTPQERKDILVAYLKLKSEDQDWRAVGEAANDLREAEKAVRAYQPLPQAPETSKESKLDPIQKTPETSVTDIPVKEAKIPHSVNVVRELLRLNDNDLVDRLFPDPIQEAE